MKIFSGMFLKSTEPLTCLLVILVSFSCYNQLPQTWLLNTSEIDSLMVLVARYSKPKAMFPPEALEERLPLLLPACGGYWHPLGYGHIPLCSIFTLPSLPLL